MHTPSSSLVVADSKKALTVSSFFITFFLSSLAALISWLHSSSSPPTTFSGWNPSDSDPVGWPYIRTISSDIGDCPELRVIELSSNRFIGEKTLTVGKLKNLQELTLYEDFGYAVTMKGNLLPLVKRSATWSSDFDCFGLTVVTLCDVQLNRIANC
ncbi:unnamed protein product [Microthlaspi erraticum]|uniref:Leucine-rich repeat-containing N-terminal plant-type domain-containing protein n=1 Tax=Microthlaspi erraticum TaxID=1685480 RepID=A0A6D2IN27_9BRAS|nr:unnamed protein product [Microthlaspi erraticum]